MVSNKIIITTLVILTIFMILPYFIYFSKFSSSNLSDDTSDWGSFGSYISGVATPLITIIIFFTSLYIASVIRTVQAKPSGHISQGDYENHQFVKIKNNGNGPIKNLNVSVKYLNEVESEKNLLSLVPPPPDDILWDTYTLNVPDVLPVGEEITLLAISDERMSSEYIEFRNRLRKRLSDITISLNYKDMYGKAQEPVVKKLSFFGRHEEYEKLRKMKKLNSL